MLSDDICDFDIRVGHLERHWLLIRLNELLCSSIKPIDIAIAESLYRKLKDPLQHQQEVAESDAKLVRGS